VLHLLASASSFDMIAEYVPGSDVTLHSRLDLDQRDLMSFLAKDPPDFEAAKRIYTEGGHSGKTTEIKLSEKLWLDYPAGTKVSQGSKAMGKLNAKAKAGDEIIKVGITSSCKGDAVSQAAQDVSGCFRKSNGDTDDNLKIEVDDVGNVTEVQLRWRTLAGFSTDAEQKMSGQAMFELYREYYSGPPDYADEFIRAALYGKFWNGMDFGEKPDIFRVECAQKATAYWSVWMYVIREMEDAIRDCTAGCKKCNDAPVHAWDEAWAFYAGSLEGSTGSSEGRMLYRLAQKRCKNFGTCGIGGIADVNKQILNLFISGKKSLEEGRCSEVRPMVSKIVNQMTVPLIQGTLRYAYKTGEKESAKDKAEGIAFLGAFIPRLWNCSKDEDQDAFYLKNLMGIHSPTKLDPETFTVVREMLEKNYACMGVTCSQVGALVDEATGEYLAGEPCKEAALSVGATVGIVVAVILVLLLLALGVVTVLKKRNPNRSESKFALF